jgi:predicted nucleic acid-binding protein
VASSNPKASPDSGFATPAATMVSLAIALIATAVTATTVSQLQLSRRDFSRARTEYALIGGQEIAALTALQNADNSRLRWPISSPTGPLQALAEPEASKLSPDAAASLADTDLAKLGITDPKTFRDHLRALAKANRVTAQSLEDADTSALWRRCSRSVISPYGAAAKIQQIETKAPTAGELYSRAGETWRIRLTSPDGWADDRIVRFTGDELHPTAIIERRLFRRTAREDPCDAMIAASQPL